MKLINSTGGLPTSVDPIGLDFDAYESIGLDTIVEADDGAIGT